MVAIGAISIGYGAGMMKRAWFAASVPDHEIVAREMNFNAEGQPISGVIDFIRAGETTRFDVINGRIVK
jgi:hypothetical protein